MNVLESNLEDFEKELRAALESAREGKWHDASVAYKHASEERAHMATRGIEDSRSSSEPYHEKILAAGKRLDDVYREIISLKPEPKVEAQTVEVKE